MKLPEQFIDTIKKQLPDGDALLAALNSGEELVSIRINKKKISPQFELEKTAWCNTGYYLNKRPSFTLDPLFHAGAYYVQEASSMFIEEIFKQPGITDKETSTLKILDLCAAPGGKSTHLLSLINTKSLLVANEVIRTRTAVLAENLSKWGHTNYVVTNNDASDFAVLENYFDVIVCDAPCSGEGMFRKDAAACNEWSAANVLLCAKRQKRIVADVWNALKPGGVFIYSTCTFNEQENEDNVKWICETLYATSLQLSLNKQWSVVETPANINVSGNTDNNFGYHFYPHKIKGEGFFIAAIRKNGEVVAEHKKSKNEKYKSKSTTGILNATDKIILPVSNWIKSADFNFITEYNYISIFPKELTEDLVLLKEKLKVVSYGTQLAEQKGTNYIPMQSLANSIDLNKDAFTLVKLNLTDALRYLKGETNFSLTINDGLVLLCYAQKNEGSGINENIFPLGFAKKIGNRINNYYPKNRMIRMQINWEKIKQIDEKEMVLPFY